MSTTTPSHIETIRHLLEEIRTLCGEAIMKDSWNLLAIECRIKANLAVSKIEALSRQPAQAPDIDKIMEVVGTWYDWYADQPIQDGPLADYEEAGYVISKAGHDELRARLTTLLQTSHSQQAQTEDLEAKAREWWCNSDEYGIEDTEPGTIKMLAAFARSLSEPK